MRLLGDPNSDPGALAELIATDAAITADVIHISNSAYHGLPQQVASVGEAVRFLGYDEVYRMVGLYLSRHMMARPLASYGLTGAEYWGECVLAGLVLQHLAPCLEVSEGAAYTTGLLHAIGRLAIDQALQTLGVRPPLGRHPDLGHHEMEWVGMTGAEIGALLLDRWRFPADITEAVRRQLHPPAADDPPLLTGLQLTRWMIRSAEGPPPHLSDRASLESRFGRWGITWPGLADLAERCRGNREILRHALGIPES